MDHPGNRHKAHAERRLADAGYRVRGVETQGTVEQPEQERVTNAAPSAKEAGEYYGGLAQKYAGPEGRGVPKIEGGRESRFDREGVMASRSRSTYRDSDTMIEAGSEDGEGRLGDRKK